MKLRLMTKLKTGFVFALLVVTTTACTSSSLLSNSHIKHKPSFYAEIIVDLVVDGEAVHIKRVVECKTFKASSGRRRTAYAATVGAMGARLKSGGAIFMWTPSSCAHHEVKTPNGRIVRRVLPTEPGYIPFMGWTPNADTFDMLEIYPAAVYFTKPNARIKVVNVSVRDAPSGASADAPDEFDRFTNQVLIGERRRSGPTFRGYSALVLERRDWIGRDPEFDALMAKATSLWAIDKSLVSDGKWAWQRAIDFFKIKYHVEGVLSPSPYIPKQNRINAFRNKLAKSPIKRESAFSKALVLKGNKDGTLEVSRAVETSFARLYRRGVIPANEPEWKVLKRGVHSLIPNPRHDSRLLFDPNTQEIYWLFVAGYVGYPHRIF